MPIPALCPSCGHKKDVPDAMAGKLVRCPKCQQKFTIPEEIIDVVLVDDFPDVLLADIEPRRASRQPSPIVASGRNGQLELLEHSVRISRKGFNATLTHMFKGDKEILLSSITGIEFKECGPIVVGYIRFLFMGNDDRKVSAVFGRRRFQGIAADENAVLFRRGKQQEFLNFKQAVERRMAALHGGGQSGRSAADELAKLADLLDRSLITKDEFNRQKRKLLD